MFYKKYPGTKVIGVRFQISRSAMELRALVAQVRYVKSRIRRPAYDEQKGMKISEEWGINRRTSGGRTEVCLHCNRRRACIRLDHGVCSAKIRLVVLPNSPIIRPASHPGSMNSRP